MDLFVYSIIYPRISGHKYQCLANTGNVLVTPRTMSNNVHRLAEEYWNLIRPILIEQAQARTLTICPDLWNDRYRKVDYQRLTAYFVNSNYELHVYDLSCSPYKEINKTGEYVLQVERWIKSTFEISNNFFLGNP